MKELSQKEKNNLFIYVMLFFTLAFIGWCFEVLNEIRKGHGFINRGVLGFLFMVSEDLLYIFCLKNIIKSQ